MINLLSSLQELNWDFSGDKSDSPLSELHFHPGRFLPQIPAALIGALTMPGDLVLDPFCGSGTTLVEAQRLGRNAVGIDINPVACLIAEVKTLNVSAEEVSNWISELLKGISIFRVEMFGKKLLEPPATVQLNKWYHPETGVQLTILWSFIQSLESPELSRLAKFCFSSSLMACCGETRTWGYICDNVRPLSCGYIDAFEVFNDRAVSLLDAFRKRDQRCISPEVLQLSEVRVLQGDAVDLVRTLLDGSVNLVVTSPPYFGVVDYVKAQRLTFEWFSIDIETYRLQEMGARSKRHRISALSDYLCEFDLLLRELFRVLRSGGVAAFVIGESVRRESVLKSVVESIERVGFRMELIKTRAISAGRRQPASIMHEEIIFCVKP